MSTLKVDGIRSNSATSDAITLASDGTCTANITNKPNRNLIINGAMLVAQRGTSSTSTGYHTVDRYRHTGSGADEMPTFAQVDVASGTTPYTSGFRKAFKITNGNQTSGAGTGDAIVLGYKLEAQDLANSGWNYVSSSSYITLSFWVKSSVAQNFYGRLTTTDGTSQNYAFETGSLSADTWTKITKTIPGNSNLTFDNNADKGIDIEWMMFRGTNFTDSGVTLNAWAAYASGTRTPDNTTTWYTTNDATFELTGVQLEVGSVATDFEFRSFAQELDLCKRYFQVIAQGSGLIGAGYGWGTAQAECISRWEKEMRTDPTIDSANGTDYFIMSKSGASVTFNYLTGWNLNKRSGLLYKNQLSGLIDGTSYRLLINNSSAYVYLNAEL